MKIALIGCRGFVGSAFARFFESRSIPYMGVDRANYSAHAGRNWDVVIHAAANSKKFVADETPLADMEQSLERTTSILRDFPAGKFLLISSVDVYNDLSHAKTTNESEAIEPMSLANYGFHKYLSELLVLRHSPHPLIFRLAGMVGPGLKKNPVFDVLNRLPLRIHPDSRYQFLHTAAVAEIVWAMHDRLPPGDILNVCGHGLVSPREIGEMAGVEPDLSLVSGPPRIVDISVEKLAALFEVPETSETVGYFLKNEIP
jgi:nucleoside-diphosphate-sugar epimerase